MDLVAVIAGDALTGTHKSVAFVQAFLILTSCALPKRNLGEDKTMLFAGVAIRYVFFASSFEISKKRAFVRMAIELGLDRPLTGMNDEREALNRERTWLSCFCVDRVLAIQFGKPAMIRSEKYARSAQEWYRKSALNTPFDVHESALVDALLIWTDFEAAVRSTIYRFAKMIKIIIETAFLGH